MSTVRNNSNRLNPHHWHPANWAKNLSNVIFPLFGQQLELRPYEVVEGERALEIRRIMLRKLLNRFTMRHRHKQPEHLSFRDQIYPQTILREPFLARQTDGSSCKCRRDWSPSVPHLCLNRNAGQQYVRR